MGFHHREHTLDFTLGSWKRPEYNSPEGRAQLVRALDAANRLGVKPVTFNMWKARYPETFPKLVATSGNATWYVWDEVAHFAAGLGYGDPALVAEAKAARLRSEVADREALVEQLQDAIDRGEAAPDAAAQLSVLRQRLTWWRRKLRNFLESTDSRHENLDAGT